MTADRLEIDGWEVAQVALERSWSGRDLADNCWLFRSPTAWTLVTMGRHVRYDDGDDPESGRATITTTAFSSLEELSAHVERTYIGGAWVELLDAGWEHDAELYRAWVPERISRDFDGASIHNKDLALYTGLFRGGAVPAPARQLPGWEADAVDQMAARLADLGFAVLDDRPTVTGEDPILGALRVRRYGWETVGVVRVDEVGEIFVRVPDASAVDGPLWQPAPDTEGAW